MFAHVLSESISSSQKEWAGGGEEAVNAAIYQKVWSFPFQLAVRKQGAGEKAEQGWVNTAANSYPVVIMKT